MQLLILTQCLGKRGAQDEVAMLISDHRVPHDVHGAPTVVGVVIWTSGNAPLFPALGQLEASPSRAPQPLPITSPSIPSRHLLRVRSGRAREHSFRSFPCDQSSSISTIDFKVQWKCPICQIEILFIYEGIHMCKSFKGMTHESCKVMMIHTP